MAKSHPPPPPHHSGGTNYDTMTWVSLHEASNYKKNEKKVERI